MDRRHIDVMEVMLLMLRKRQFDVIRVSHTTSGYHADVARVSHEIHAGVARVTCTHARVAGQ